MAVVSITPAKEEAMVRATNDGGVTVDSHLSLQEPAPGFKCPNCVRLHCESSSFKTLDRFFIFGFTTSTLIH